AMYVAKKSGGGFAVYSPEHEGQTLRQSGLAGNLRRSMTQGELVLHYQPIVLLPAHTTYALEALVRWNHPREGLLPPDRFISLAEETNVIRPLTSWVLDTALAQLARWVASGEDVSVAVNVSPRCLDDPSIVEDVTRALATSRVEPRRLTLEVSEGAAMSAPAAKALERLAEMGVRLSLDDFGTGYSSLVYLKRLPIHEIKIDRSFVKTLPGDPDAAAIVRAAVGLGHSLGLRVIAEGVEDRDAEAMTRDQLSVTDAAAVRAALERHRPEVVFNCAAYNPVDRAEMEPDQALSVNSDGAFNAAVACRSLGVALVHYSTNFVFDGRLDRPYLESDLVGPLGAYARSKADGERRVLAEHPAALVIRTAALFGDTGSRAKGGSFPERIVRAAREGKPLAVVADQKVNP